MTDHLIYTVALKGDAVKTTHPLKGRLHRPDADPKLLFTDWGRATSNSILGEITDHRADHHSVLAYVNGIRAGMEAVGYRSTISVVYEEDVHDVYGTEYWAVFEDETGCEFGAGCKAMDKGTARSMLSEQYPESRIVQLESPEEAREREHRTYVAAGEDDWGADDERMERYFF